MPSVTSRVKSWYQKSRSKKLREAPRGADQSIVSDTHNEPIPYTGLPVCILIDKQTTTFDNFRQEYTNSINQCQVPLQAQTVLYKQQQLVQEIALKTVATSEAAGQTTQTYSFPDGHNAIGFVQVQTGGIAKHPEIATSHDEQAEGERRQCGKVEFSKETQKALSSANPQGLSCGDVSNDVTRPGVSHLNIQGEGSHNPGPSGHITASPQAPSPGSDRKGKAPEVEGEFGSGIADAHSSGPLPSMQVEGYSSAASAGRYSRILSAVGVPCSRPGAQEAWWNEERVPVRTVVAAERAEAPKSRLEQILTTVGVPSTGSLAGGSGDAREGAKGASNSDEDAEGGDLRLLFTEGSAEATGIADAPALPPPLAATMADDVAALLVAQRPFAPPALPPDIQALFDKQDALRAHISLLEPDPSHQPLMTRLETIRTLLLESGSALGGQELESLEGEVAAVDLVLKLEQEEMDIELDRMLSANLQQEFDEEYAAQLERSTGGMQSVVESDEMVDCCICLEEVAKRDCIAACLPPGSEAAHQGGSSGSEEDGEVIDAPLSSLLASTCSHWHCIDCLRQYATVRVMDDRTAHIPCTRAAPGGCPGLFPFDNVEWLLGEKENAMYTLLLAEESIGTKVYCPFDGCAAVMDCAPDERGPDSICALCNRVFCRSCRVAWHAGRTCAQYLSAKEDEPLLALAKEKKWKPCPKCQNMVERKEGCNYIRCKCGAGFCYKCGAGYTSDAGTSSNVHGTAGCKCRLFS